MRYRPYLRFLAPLIATVIVQELSVQVLNGGMARMPEATETLASYGLAWGLVLFFASPLVQTRQLGLVLVDSFQALRSARRFVGRAGLLLGVIVLLLARGPVGRWVLEDLHRVEPALATVVQDAMIWLIPIPLLRGTGWFYSGLLLRAHRTDWVSGAILAGIGVSIAMVFLLLPAPFIQRKPILLPLLVTYGSTLTELGLILWAERRYVPSLLKVNSAALPLPFRRIFHFFWPLALIMSIQGFSRPLINLFVAREPNGEEALAVLTVVYALAHAPYGWLNELRNLPPAFRDEPDSLTHIRRFALRCGGFSFAVMLGMFWTPARGFVLERLIGVDPRTVLLCGVPLMIFSFFPLTVMIRSYLHGLALVQERTKALAPSGPARIGAIWIALMLIPTGAMHGATRGVVALLTGFVIETSLVWWCVALRGVAGKSSLS